MKSAFKDMGTIRNLTPRASLMIRDLDIIIPKYEVQTALDRYFKEHGGEIKFSLIKSNRKEQNMAIVKAN